MSAVRELRFVGSFPSRALLPAGDRPEVAFAGRSNVGKSSAINRLVGRRALMRVSRTPGATRLLNVLEWGDELRLVDLPGYGYARVSKQEREKWGRTLGDYLEHRSSLAMIVLVVDIRHPPKERDLLMMGLALQWEVPCVMLATKSDRITRNQAQTRVARMRKEIQGKVEVVRFSSKTGEGLVRLNQLIAEHTGVEAPEA